MATTARLRIRLFLDERIVDEVWVYSDAEVMAASADHYGQAREAHDAGRTWMVEFYDPSMPEDQAYLRTGTSADAMVHPHVSGDPEAIDAIQRWVEG